MTRWLLRLPIVAAIVTGPAQAQTLLDPNCKNFQGQIQIQEDLTLLIGDVEFDCGTWQFFADQIEMKAASSELVASGNVVYVSGKSRVAADRVVFDRQTLTGAFYNATGTIALGADVARNMFGSQEPEIMFWGELIEKLGPRTYKLTRGAFTSCIQPTPRWEMTASSVTINLDSYALMRNSVLQVKGVPLFYLPVLYYPIQEDGRATGLLMPTYGQSTIRGQSISNAFFWAINRSHDATFFHDWFTSTGQGVGAEYRYLFAPGSEGFASTYVLNERQTTNVRTIGGVEREIVTPGRRSYQIRGNAAQRFGSAVSARGQVNYFTDVTVQQTYNSNIYEASNRVRSLGGNSTGSWGAYTLSGTFDWNETFFGDTVSTLNGSGPRIAFSQSERAIGATPLYFAFGSEYARLLRSTNTGSRVIDVGLQRIDVNPTLRVPFTRWPFFTITSSASWHGTYWTESLDTDTGAQVPEGLLRRFFDVGTQVTGPVFVKVWDTPGSGYAERMKHVIEPWVGVRRMTAFDNFNEIVQLEGVDSIVGSVTQIRYGLDNRLYAKRAEGTPTAVAQEIVTVSVSQSYYTDDKAAQFDRYFRSSFSGTPPSHFSPISLVTRVAPTRLLSGTMRAEYDMQFGALRTIGAEGSVEVGGWLHTTGGWSQRRFIEDLPGFNDPSQLDHYLNTFTSVQTRGNRVGGVYAMHYDLQRDRFLQQRIVGYYNAQCCGFAVEYQSFNFEGLGGRVPVSFDRRLNVSFTLAGLGTFSNVLGAFGVGTERRP